MLNGSPWYSGDNTKSPGITSDTFFEMILVEKVNDVRQRMDIGTALWGGMLTLMVVNCLPVNALSRLSIMVKKKPWSSVACCDTGTTTCPLESLIN